MNNQIDEQELARDLKLLVNSMAILAEESKKISKELDILNCTLCDIQKKNEKESGTTRHLRELNTSFNSQAYKANENLVSIIKQLKSLIIEKQ